MIQDRSPGVKLFFAALIGGLLLVPLLMVYALVNDRQSQSSSAEAAITAGWGGEQTITGPVLVIPYQELATETATVDGQQRSSTKMVRRELFLSPVSQRIETTLDPDIKSYSIYRSVIYESEIAGTASFALTADVARSGVKPGQLMFDQAELRFGVSDPRGLTDGTQVTASGEKQALHPGGGPAST
ncbi:MAG: inner membrane CreD family protein, partial [Pontixanthobacter sp.]